MLETLHILGQTEHAEETGGIGALGLDPLAIAAQALTFLVLFFVIRKYALTKIVATLENRRKTIDRGLHLTAEMDKLKAELEDRVDQTLREARSEADNILNEARLESGNVIRAAEETANRKADAILEEANGKIAREIESARSGLKNEVAGMVVEVSETILREKVTDSKDRQLVEKYVSEALK